MIMSASKVRPNGSTNASTYMPTLRQFAFFDGEEVATSDEDAIQTLRQPLILETTSNQSPTNPVLFIGSADEIILLDRQLNIVRRFDAWKNDGRATLLKEAGGILFAIGDEGDNGHPMLKIWDLTRMDQKRSRPTLLRSVRIQNGQRPQPASCISLSSNLSHLAIGFVDGTVLMYRHFLQSLTASTSLSSLPKARTVHQSSDPVTGLAFLDTDADAGPVLLITTINNVLSASTLKNSPVRNLDDVGAELSLAKPSPDLRFMIVARDDGIYVYDATRRVEYLPSEGRKTSLNTFRGNVITVSPSTSALGRTKTDGRSESSAMAVFDLKHQWVAYSTVVQSGIQQIFCLWGSIFIRDGLGKVIRLSEQSLSAKLQTLSNRNLYDSAVQLARSEGSGEATIADIFRCHGDFLYEKGDYDGAMSKYINTLGTLPPSYVVRKFLDVQRIQNLISYLEDLHSRSLANPNHTTLLLNCYTKTGDKASLDTFLRADEGRTELPFDLDTAIRVCRQAGFFDHASSLARRWGRHEDYLRIQLEDAGQYQAALEYFRSLSQDICQENLLQYGGTLLQHLPIPTTDILIDICTGRLHRRLRPSKRTSSPPDDHNGPTMLSYLGVERVTNIFGDDSSKVREAAMPEAEEAVNNEGATATQIISPSPRIFFPLFVDLPQHFVRFLETVARKLWGSDDDDESTDDLATPDRLAVYNTLLELYITIDPVMTESNKSKALKVLSDPRLGLDPIHALILCSRAKFEEGCLILWEQLNMHEDVLRYWTDVASSSSSNGPAKSPSDEVIAYLGRHGQEHPELYSLALRFLTSSNTIMAQHSTQLSHILDMIDEKHILPPLAVIQVLSRNHVASIGSLREWLKSKVEDTRMGIDSDKHLVKSYRLETEQKETEIKQLADPERPQVFQVTRCAACNTHLDLPTVHFMCKHSYHQRCLPDMDPECILCSRQHSIVRELRQGQRRLADRHDLFLNEVHEADDGFAVVAGGFGRGLFGDQVASN